MCQQSGNLLPMSLTRYRTIRRDVSQNLAQICQYLSVRLLTMKICAVTEVTAYVGEGERPLASSETVSPGAQKFSKNLETTSNFQAGQEWHDVMFRTLNPHIVCANVKILVALENRTRSFLHFMWSLDKHWWLKYQCNAPCAGSWKWWLIGALRPSYVYCFNSCTQKLQVSLGDVRFTGSSCDAPHVTVESVCNFTTTITKQKRLAPNPPPTHTHTQDYPYVSSAAQSQHFAIPIQILLKCLG